MPHRLNWLRSYLWIRQCIGGAQLECGCFTGRYLTYSGRTVEIIDAPAPGCARKDHARNTVVAGEMAD